MPFRFVHTADIHLDSPLKSLALRDAALAEAIGTATRAVFTRIVDLCLDEAVDALLIAGDLYDGDQTSMKTARFLAQQMQRLAEAGVRLFVIRGNHDAASRITRELVLPENVTVFRPRAGRFEIATAGRPVVVHGISFRDPHAPDSLLDRFSAPVPGAVNIGMLHTSLGGAAGHDPYAPCSLADLQATGFDYWALGHVHVRAVHPGRTTVVMPGMPQGRDIGEAGPKSVTLVTVADDGALSLEERATALAEFARLPVEVGGLADWRDLVAALGTAIRTAGRGRVADHLVLRPMLTGATPLAWRVLRDRDLLLSEAMVAAEAQGGVWIDKLEILTRSGQAGAGGAGALDDLSALVDAEALPSPAVAARAAGIADEVIRALPRALRDLLGTDPAAVAAVEAELLRDGAAEVLARIHPGGEDA